MEEPTDLKTGIATAGNAIATTSQNIERLTPSTLRKVKRLPKKLGKKTETDMSMNEEPKKILVEHSKEDLNPFWGILSVNQRTDYGGLLKIEN